MRIPIKTTMAPSGVLVHEGRAGGFSLQLEVETGPKGTLDRSVEVPLGTTTDAIDVASRLVSFARFVASTPHLTPMEQRKLARRSADAVRTLDAFAEEVLRIQAAVEVRREGEKLAGEEG